MNIIQGVDRYGLCVYLPSSIVIAATKTAGNDFFQPTKIGRFFSSATLEKRDDLPNGYTAAHVKWLLENGFDLRHVHDKKFKSYLLHLMSLSDSSANAIHTAFSILEGRMVEFDDLLMVFRNWGADLDSYETTSGHHQDSATSRFKSLCYEKVFSYITSAVHLYTNPQRFRILKILFHSALDYRFLRNERRKWVIDAMAVTLRSFQEESLEPELINAISQLSCADTLHLVTLLSEHPNAVLAICRHRLLMLSGRTDETGEDIMQVLKAFRKDLRNAPTAIAYLEMMVRAKKAISFTTAATQEITNWKEQFATLEGVCSFQRLEYDTIRRAISTSIELWRLLDQN